MQQIKMLSHFRLINVSSFVQHSLYFIEIVYIQYDNPRCLDQQSFSIQAIEFRKYFHVISLERVQGIYQKNIKTSTEHCPKFDDKNNNIKFVPDCKIPLNWYIDFNLSKIRNDKKNDKIMAQNAMM